LILFLFEPETVINNLFFSNNSVFQIETLEFDLAGFRSEWSVLSLSKRADRSVVAALHVDDLDFPVGAVRGRRVRSTVLRIVLMPPVVFVKSPHDHDEAARVRHEPIGRVPVLVRGHSEPLRVGPILLRDASVGPGFREVTFSFRIVAPIPEFSSRLCRVFSSFVEQIFFRSCDWSPVNWINWAGNSKSRPADIVVQVDFVLPAVQLRLVVVNSVARLLAESVESRQPEVVSESRAVELDVGVLARPDS